MGWRGSRGTIAAGMLFKKMYCQRCGNKLKIKKNIEIVRKGDKGYSSKLPGVGNTLGMSSYYDVTYIYNCPNCGLEITYDAQCMIAKKQRLLKSKIIEGDDLKHR